MTTRFDMRLYPMVLVGAMLVAGILLGDALCNDAVLRAMPMVMLGLIVAVVLTLRYRFVSMLLLMVSIVVLGMWRIGAASQATDVVLPENEVEYDAVVVSEPVVHGKVVWMDLLLLSDSATLPVKASLLRDTVEHRYRSLHVGCGMRAYSRVEREERSGGLRTFIYYSHWQPAVVSLSPLSLVQRARLRLMDFRGRLATIFSDQAVVRAMVLGDKSQLSKDLRNDYSLSGASHLLALSGLHLSIIYALLSMVAFRMRRHWTGQVAILLAIWGYVLLVGMMPSVVRAALMITIYSFATILGRDRLSVNTWALAAVVMLLVSPQSLWDLGFQMSFLAVLSILLVVPMLTSAPFLQPLRSRRVERWLVDMLAVSLAAQVGTMPLIAHVFGRVAVYGMLVNVVAVPLAMLVVWMALACLLVAWSPVLLSIGQEVVGVLSHWLNLTVGYVASLPGASLDVSLSVWQTVSCYVLLASLLLLVRFCSVKKYV